MYGMCRCILLCLCCCFFVNVESLLESCLGHAPRPFSRDSTQWPRPYKAFGVCFRAESYRFRSASEHCLPRCIHVQPPGWYKCILFHSCKPTHSGLQPILVCYQFTALLRFRAQRWQNTTSVGDVMYLLSSDALRDSNRVLTGRWTRCVSVYPSSRHGRFPCRWQPPAVEGTRAWTARSAIASSRKNSCTGPSTVSVTGPARDGVVSRSRSCSKPYRNSYMPTCVMPIAMRACVTPFPGPPSCIEVRIKDQASRSSSQVA